MLTSGLVTRMKKDGTRERRAIFFSWNDITFTPESVSGILLAAKLIECYIICILAYIKIFDT